MKHRPFDSDRHTADPLWWLVPLAVALATLCGFVLSLLWTSLPHAGRTPGLRQATPLRIDALPLASSAPVARLAPSAPPVDPAPTVGPGSAEAEAGHPPTF